MDWHGAELTRATVIDRHYRHTQNVRRFDRDLKAWIRSEIPKTLGDVMDERQRRQRAR
ncbi:DUF6434 domain-containing protein [Pseudomonas flavocrustae]|uniref:DUF6434 domain-containing protein n=1 Tax=Pseudomonas flavocrustae TaxID=2991719 RepID=UPI0032AF8F56